MFSATEPHPSKIKGSRNPAISYQILCPCLVVRYLAQEGNWIDLKGCALQKVTFAVVALRFSESFHKATKIWFMEGAISSQQKVTAVSCDLKMPS